ncbi:MAG: sulfite exporter TauE/SafE family protein [Alphaproteobacteria bacterium]|nr:sulfite exporter TauE/SafE family protein [Alphaproteobacteria bacterium]
MAFDPSVFSAMVGAPQFPIAAAVAAAAGLLRGFAGFGSAMLMAPIFAILFDATEMVLLVAIMELATSLHLFPQTRRDCRWSLVGPVTIAACLAMPVGIWILFNVDRVAIQKFVSAAVVIFALVMLTGWRWRGGRALTPTIVVGAVSGAMMATTSVGGPPVILYLLSGDDPARIVRANVIAFYFITLTAICALVFWFGAAGWSPFAWAALLLPFMLGGSAIGSRLFRGAHERVYRNVALAVLAIVGVIGLIG